MTAKYNHDLPTRIVIKAKRDGKRVYYHWHIEQEARWATRGEREKEDFVEPEPFWDRVEIADFNWDHCGYDCRSDLRGSERSHYKAEEKARIELAKVLAYYHEKARNEEWTENNTTVLDA